MDEEQTSRKKMWIIIGGIVLLLVIGILVYFLILKNKGEAGGIKSLGSLFGNSGPDTGRANTDITAGN